MSQYYVPIADVLPAMGLNVRGFAWLIAIIKRIITYLLNNKFDIVNFYELTIDFIDNSLYF